MRQSIEVKHFNADMIKRKCHEPQKPISNARRFQAMMRYLRSIGY